MKTVFSEVVKRVREMEKNLTYQTPPGKAKLKKAKWLIVGDSFNSQRIQAAIQLSGRDAKIYTVKEAWSTNFKPDPSTIVYGSPSAVERLSRLYGFNSWQDVQGLSCSSYFGNWGHVMYNDNHVLYSMGEVLRQKDTLFKYFGKNDKIFIRANSPTKPFFGGVYSEYELEQAGKYVDKGEICLVSTPKPKACDYRFIIKGLKVITGCQIYPSSRKLYTSRMMDFVNSVAKHKYKGLPEIYAMDITTRLNKYKVLSLNAVNVVGWHLMDYDRIVEACSKEVENK